MSKQESADIKDDKNEYEAEEIRPQNQIGPMLKKDREWSSKLSSKSDQRPGNAEAEFAAKKGL